METLQLLGVALGLATLAGLNLYLTVFVTGLAIQQHWIDVAQSYPELAILAHPAILAVSGTFYLLQFFADKVPWVDSLWDAIHTVIKPVGGALLAVSVLGQTDPIFDVIVALLGGSVTLIAHSMKAGTRLVANHSPEPFSNIALSVTEDVAVLGGLALIKYDARLALAVFSIIILTICYFAPKLFRTVKVHAWLVWRKIAAPAVDAVELEVPTRLPHELDIAFHSVNLEGDPILWSVPCISTAARGIPGNYFGYLISTKRNVPKAAFVAKRRWRNIGEEINLDRYKVAHESKFLSENVVFYSLEKKPKYVFVFDRSQRAVVKAITALIEARISSADETALPAGESAQPRAQETGRPELAKNV